MAITGSSASVDQSRRDNLLNSNLKNSTLGDGAKLDTQVSFSKGANFGFPTFTFEATGNKVAGITPEFLSKFTSAVNEYCENVKSSIDELSSVQEDKMKSAFKGTAVEGSITKFIESVKEVANNYLKALQESENQIAESVHNAYTQQDTDISSDLNKDAGSLVDAGPNV